MSGDVKALERWSDIQNDPDAIVACGERWKSVAGVIGCTLLGFNDGLSASFTTPDGNVIEVGAGLRTALTDLQARLEAAEAENAKLREALGELIGAVDDLIADSGGVYGLHMNGDPAPWGELTEGGRFEGWLLPLERARATLGGEHG